MDAKKESEPGLAEGGGRELGEGERDREEERRVPAANGTGECDEWVSVSGSNFVFLVCECVRTRVLRRANILDLSKSRPA